MCSIRRCLMWRSARDPAGVPACNPTSSYLWRRVVPQIGGRVAAWRQDLIGIGDSGKPPVQYRFADHAATWTRGSRGSTSTTWPSWATTGAGHSPSTGRPVTRTERAGRCSWRRSCGQCRGSTSPTRRSHCSSRPGPRAHQTLIWDRHRHLLRLRAALLLDRVAMLLDSQPSPVEGGRWELYTLAEEVRRTRAVEQPDAWLRLQDERWAARRCIRAATALVVAVRERDTARLRACIEVFEEANQAYEGFSS
jgi:hypothetical protein